MSIDVGIDVATERDAIVRFERFPARARALILDRITRITAELDAMVLAAEPNRTGKLLASTAWRVINTARRIVGVVTITRDWGKAGALEYGAHRSTKVKAHQAKLGHVFAQRLAQPLTVMVSMHHRIPNIAEHRFLRGPFDAIRERAFEELHAALAEAENE